mgnify:FL=1
MNRGCVVVAIFMEEVNFMHMADALISPAVGGTLWAAGAALTGYSVKQIGPEFHEQKAPLMGVLGAFVFAAQMINFAIPGTGSSGHLGGGLLLAVLLGPYAGFLTMASILTIQALLFADGGLLALGCNIVNLAFFPCFVAYPLIFRPLAAGQSSRLRLAVAVTAAVVVGLQLGALGVVTETLLSGISALPFSTFVLFMLPIHLAIGLVEAAVTTAVLWFVQREAPDLLTETSVRTPAAAMPLRKIIIGFLVAALFTGGLLSWFASADPDGLEWAIQKTAGTAELDNSGPLHLLAASWQEKTSLLPDYQAAWLNFGGNDSTAAAGLIGVGLTLLLAGAVGVGCRALVRRN